MLTDAENSIRSSQSNGLGVSGSNCPYTSQKSAPSRVVVVASSAHLRGHINMTDINGEKEYDAGASYNQSKLANVMFARELARKLSGTGVTVNAVDPGLVDTKLMRHMGVFKSFSG